MKCRTFTRRWWANKAETIPAVGRRNYRQGKTYDSTDEARRACQSFNRNLRGGKRPDRGPYGLAMEFEEL